MLDAAKPYVLIIEDTEDIAVILQITLSTSGFETRHAPNGTQALRIFGERRPDLILLDIGMPDMNGWQVLEAIKKQFPDANMPVIVLTAFDDPANKLIGKLQHLVYRYLTKPFDPERLRTTAREAVGMASPDAGRS
jgi:DNA-binding response OmpR family regulator